MLRTKYFVDYLFLSQEKVNPPAAIFTFEFSISFASSPASLVAVWWSPPQHTMFTARVKHSDGEDVEGLRRVFPAHEDMDVNFGDFLSQWSGQDFGERDSLR